MDLICTSCAEPWDLDYVLHDEPEGFEREGAAIVSCPCCKERKDKLSGKERAKLRVAAELGQLLGDDVDGYAAELEDYFAQRQLEEASDRELVAYSDGTVRRAPQFALGQLVATRGALAALGHEEMLKALTRHAAGDWGELDAEDWEANERALREGARLFSVYRSAAGQRFYVITEWDRSCTTVLLPEDY